MHILITGASGFIGSHLVKALQREGYQLTLAVRDVQGARQRWPQLRVIHADFSSDHQVARWAPRVVGIDVVINAVGIITETAAQSFGALHTDAPCALFKAAARAGVNRVIQISALGADETARSQYHLSKRAADDCLMQQDVNGTILMPSVVYGPGANSMAFFKAMAALPVTPLMEQGEQRLQPIHVDDLVRVVLQLIQSTVPNHQRIALVGPEPISMRELYTQLRLWLGFGTGRFISFPHRWMLRFAGVGEFFGRALVTRETIQMLYQGSTADVKPLVYQFGFEPIRLQDSLNATPALQADRWYAGLYVLRPLLRISLALLWLFTGLVSAFMYPAQLSYLLLEQAGINSLLAPVMLYGAAVLDVVLGLALLFKYHIRWTAMAQIALMVAYTLIISVSQPDFWLHPFGPISKNVPLIIVTLVMLVLERR